MASSSVGTSGIPLAPRALQDHVLRHGGVAKNGARGVVRRLVTVKHAGPGDLAPLLGSRYVDDAIAAIERGALLLIDEPLADREDVAKLPGWFHPHAAWALAELLDGGDVPPDAPVIGDGTRIGLGAVILPRVTIGARVTIGPGAVIGDAGFGFALGPGGTTRAIPHLAGVVIEDDVHIGALCTIAAGTLSPTRVKAGAKLDAQVHVGHNCEIGEGTMIAAQTGLAGSVVVGRGVLMGGQVGVSDHVTIGDGARVAAKSGVIGDVAEGSTVAGYPAVERHRWLRGLAELYRLASSRGSSRPPPDVVASSGSMRAARAVISSPPLASSQSPASSPPRASSPPPASSPSPGPVSSRVRPEAIIRRSDRPSGPGMPVDAASREESSKS